MRLRKKLAVLLALGSLLAGGSVIGAIGVASAQTKSGAANHAGAVTQPSVEKSGGAESQNEAADAGLPGGGHEDPPGTNVNHQAEGVE